MRRTMRPIKDWVVWDEVAGRSSRKITPRLMTIHTAVTDSQDIYGPGLGPGRTHAHFYNPKQGMLRQHQAIDRQAFADGQGNSFCVSVEHWDGYPNGAPGYWKHDGDVPPLTDSQIENDARLFAHLVRHFGLPNRIATPDDVSGLGWHRLGVAGNFGRFDPRDRKTWSRAQTGLNFSGVFGKLCPGDRRIDQIQEIYDRAQDYLRGGEGTPAAPAVAAPVTVKGEDMALIQDAKGDVWVTNGVSKRHVPHPSHLGDLQALFGGIRKVSQAVADSIPVEAAGVVELATKTNHAAGRLDRAMPRVEAELAALKAAVGTLANSQGLDPGLIQATISEAVDRALADVSITLTSEKEGDR